MIDSPMQRLITCLLYEAAPLDNPIANAIRGELPPNAQPRLLECQVVLKGGYTAAGVIMEVADGSMLRMVSIAQKPDKTVVMADQYFDFNEVQTIVVGRDMPKQLVTPARNGNSPIIHSGH